jgi:hypothetical protein
LSKTLPSAWAPEVITPFETLLAEFGPVIDVPMPFPFAFASPDATQRPWAPNVAIDIPPDHPPVVSFPKFHETLAADRPSTDVDGAGGGTVDIATVAVCANAFCAQTSTAKIAKAIRVRGCLIGAPLSPSSFYLFSVDKEHPAIITRT